MSIKSLIRPLIVAVVGVAMAISAGSAFGQAKFKWKMQTLWQAGTINQKVDQGFADEVKAASNGRLEIQVVPVGAIVGYTETLEAMGNGILDAHQSGSGYFSGKNAAFALLSDENGLISDPYLMQEWFWYGGGKDIARELYKRYNVFYVGPVQWGVESLNTKKPIYHIAGFKGVKLRVPEGTGQDIFKAIGAAPVGLPGSEVYTSLDRGVIDGADWGTIAMNVDLGFQKVVKYMYYPGFHSMPMSEVAVSMKRWNELPADLKAIVEVCTRDLNRAMIQKMDIANHAAVKKAKASGVTIIDLSKKDRQIWRRAVRKVLAKYAQRSPMAQKMYDSQIAFLKKMGAVE